MAGIYIHIPFCKTRCIYCDFFSCTSTREKESYVKAICEELKLQKGYLQDAAIETLYFGGGTPSLLSATDFDRLFEQLSEWIPIKALQEVTLEANPDDITPVFLDSIRHLPFNRISLGVQSFQDKELLFLKRRHNSQAAIQAVHDCKKTGFDNISIDLMYGLPYQTMENWKENLQRAIDLDVQHISAYHLTYEEKTKLHQMLESRLISMLDEELSVLLFEKMIDRLTGAGFEHYEISNFGKKNFHSKHNSSYWNGTHYLGIGASAHSYNGKSRQWNISSIQQYTSSIHQGQLPFELEKIDSKMAYNDYIITRMRTSEGINLNELNELFGEKQQKYCLTQSLPHIANSCIEKIGTRIRLTGKGIFISDGIMRDLLL